jgi:hypothetical protein
MIFEIFNPPAEAGGNSKAKFFRGRHFIEGQFIGRQFIGRHFIGRHFIGRHSELPLASASGLKNNKVIGFSQTIILKELCHL